MVTFLPLVSRSAGDAVRARTDAVGAAVVRRAVDQHARRRSAPTSSSSSIRTCWRTARCCRAPANGFAVSIEAGCNGVEATIVLVAAILAFPAPWKRKLVGLAIGIVRRAGAQHRARDQPVLSRPMELQRLRMGAPLRLAGADHARRADRLAALGAHPAARRRRRSASLAAVAALAVDAHRRLACAIRPCWSSPGCACTLFVWCFASRAAAWPDRAAGRVCHAASRCRSRSGRRAARRHTITFVTSLKAASATVAAAARAAWCRTKSTCGTIHLRPAAAGGADPRRARAASHCEIC